MFGYAMSAVVINKTAYLSFRARLSLSQGIETVMSTILKDGMLAGYWVTYVSNMTVSFLQREAFRR